MGTGVGSELGFGLGIAIGETVGALEGAVVGAAVGNELGNGDGWTVGVGLIVAPYNHGDALLGNKALSSAQEKEPIVG